MHTPSSTWAFGKLGSYAWVAVVLCAAGAASCSRDGSAIKSAPGDADVSATAGREAMGGTGPSGGLTGTGGAGGVSSVGGTTGTAGFTGAAGSTRIGGTSVATRASTGGAKGGRSGTLGDGGIGGSATGGLTASGAGSLGSSAGGTSGTGGSGAGGNTGTGNRVDGGFDTALDAPARSDGQAGDLPVGTAFYEGLVGIWLVGWRDGDSRHYSWVRLTGLNYGTTEYLSGASLPSNTPYWACDGKSSWFSTEGPYSIMLRFPSTCTGALDAFFTFRAPPDTAVPPAGARMGMVAPSGSATRPLTEWWRFPDDQCDATMSTCKSPF